mmetsp:Transcript_18927/g.34283  ORF Transcript_18927/g.34283 Transcript_18927/m.34283 type:complete len:101 (-) Transcript_18927:37-339(-)
MASSSRSRPGQEAQLRTLMDCREKMSAIKATHGEDLKDMQRLFGRLKDDFEPAARADSTARARYDRLVNFIGHLDAVVQKLDALELKIMPGAQQVSSARG